MLRRVVAFAFACAFGGCTCGQTAPAEVDAARCCPAGPDAISGCMRLGGLSTGLVCPLVCDGPGACGSFLTGSLDAFGCPVVIHVGGKCPPDAAPDVAKDVSPPDCPPDLWNFHPPPMTPPTPPENACTPAEIQQMYDACFGASNTTATCDAFRMANAACAGCVEGPQAASTWGPLVDGAGLSCLNEPGCIALVTGDASPPGCAGRMQTQIDCEDSACSHCLSVDDPQETAYGACIAQADGDVCAPYVAATCSPDAAAVAACTSFSDFQSGFVLLATMFCAAD